MIFQVVASCHNRYSKSKCWFCSYKKNCPHDCGRCLHYIHTPSAAPAPRKYDCGHMMDYYVCRYAHKYTSELCYAFRKLKDVRDKKSIKVLSIGCGPCTDLLALDLLRKREEYAFETLEYRGIDINTGIWKKVLSDIYSYTPNGYDVSIVEADACTYIDVLEKEDWRPDVIVLQYVFSDMQKNSATESIEHLLNALGKYVSSCSENMYVVCNDINLSTRLNGGREYFDVLLNKIQGSKEYRQYHFNNSKKKNHYNYGREYPENSLVVSPSEDLLDYEPYLSCSSAQMIIKRVNE